MGIDIGQFRELVIKPTLLEMGQYSRDAECLLVGTALVESNLEFMHQLGGGPALGVYQMEPKTHNDIWQNYLSYRAPLAKKIAAMSTSTEANELIWNLKYATAMARAHYLRVAAAIPSYDDVEALAAYHKEWYNTPFGATKLEHSKPVFGMVAGLFKSES